MKKVEICIVVDDDPIFIYGTTRIMKEIKFADKIIVYKNGQEALDGIISLNKTENCLPDVIFLDLNMPIMNGWEFLEEYNKLPNPTFEKTTIYIVSSSVDPRDIDRVKNYKQVNNYILKPITSDDLESVLNESKIDN